jgi:hypothetical protein
MFGTFALLCISFIGLYGYLNKAELHGAVSQNCKFNFEADMDYISRLYIFAQLM